jgi:hypothetical protein
VDDEAAANYTQRAVSPQALKAGCGRRPPVLLQLHTSSSARDTGLITAILVVIAWAAAALGLGAWRTSTREIY